jgi:signal transduction histidine kinase
LFDKERRRVEYIYGVVHDITPRKEAEHRLRSLAGELVQTEERERRRMATYLHDVIGQSLTLSYLKLHLWQKHERPDDPELDEIRGILDQVLQDAHSLTFDLCPPIIYELSLGEALAWLANQLRNQHKVPIHMEFCEEKVFVAQELHVLLFQAARELLVNAIKHANAEWLRLELCRVDGRVRIVVSDNGVGFDPTTRSQFGGGFGLFNIRDRLSDFGAALDIDSVPGSGTQITILVDAK